MFLTGLVFIALALILFIRFIYLIIKWCYYEWLYNRNVKKQKGYKKFKKELKDLL